MNIIVAALTVSEKSSNISKKRLVHWRNYFKPICGPSFWLHIKNFHARVLSKAFLSSAEFVCIIVQHDKKFGHAWMGWGQGVGAI